MNAGGVKLALQASAFRAERDGHLPLRNQHGRTTQRPYGSAPAAGKSRRASERRRSALQKRAQSQSRAVIVLAHCHIYVRRRLTEITVKRGKKCWVPGRRNTAGRIQRFFATAA